jgi:hypothetical protein
MYKCFSFNDPAFLPDVSITPFIPFIWVAGDPRTTTFLSVIKLDFNGNVLNSYTLPGNPIVLGLTVDKFMNVYITCMKTTGNPTVYKMDKDFNQIWSYDTGFNLFGIAVDQNGNVGVCGSTRGSGQDTVFYFNKDGVLQWSGLPTTHGTNNAGLGLDCNFDLSGNLYVGNTTGISGVTGQIRKFSSSGTELWNQSHGALVRSVRPNRAGDLLYIQGVRNAGSGNISHRQLDTSNGNINWSLNLANLSSNSSENGGIEIDDVNNELYTQVDGGSSLTYRKFQPNGTLLWTATGLPPFATYGRAYDTTIDGDGFFYTTQQNGSPSGGYLRKYRESDRVLMWSFRHGSNTLTDRLVRVIIYPRPWTKLN